MKKISLFLSLFLLAFGSYAQKSCCELTASTKEFAAFANDKEFVATHQNPLAYTHISEVGKAISFEASDGKTAYGYELKAKKKSKNYLFVIHEWWGLNDHIKREAEKLYNDLDINVIALDLYDQKVATQREEAANYMKAATAERSKAIIEGALKYAGKKAKVFTIGWCFGGAWSLQATLLAGKKANGCVMYYGMPEKDINKLKTIETDVLGIFAGKEKWISSEIVAEFEKNMKEAGKNITVKSFDAEHAFANPSNPNFDEVATKEAYQMTIDFLKKRIKK